MIRNLSDKLKIAVSVLIQEYKTEQVEDIRQVTHGDNAQNL